MLEESYQEIHFANLLTVLTVPQAMDLIMTFGRVEDMLQWRRFFAARFEKHEIQAPRMPPR